MTGRIKEDSDLARVAEENIIRRPIIVVEKTDDDREQFRIHIDAMDRNGMDPRLFGILISDLLDHIAAAYHRQTGRDERAVREQIVKTMRDEDRFKVNDPSRGGARGTTIFPKRN
jgi:hypothetical protein